MITMWSGAINNIPTGWALCDGNNGTPNLTDRFVVGAGSTYTVGAVGGEATHTLTTAELPSHDHSFYAWSSSGSGGTHDYLKANVSSGGQVGKERGAVSRTTSTEMVGSTGSGVAHENRPPYYALAYIMKL